MITNLKHTTVCLKSDYYTSLRYNPGAHWLWISGQLHFQGLPLQIPAKQEPMPTGPKHSLYPGKTAEPRRDNPLFTHRHPLCWLPSQGENLIHGAGGLNCWCHPGTPMDTSTFTKDLLDQRWGSSVGRRVFPALFKETKEDKAHHILVTRYLNPKFLHHWRPRVPYPAGDAIPGCV